MTLALATLTRGAYVMRSMPDAELRFTPRFAVSGPPRRIATAQIRNKRKEQPLMIKKIQNDEDEEYFEPIREFYLQDTKNSKTNADLLYTKFTSTTFWTTQVHLGGKSGSYMWKSEDNQFLLKTMKKDDVDGLKTILTDGKYLKRLNDGSLLPRILAVFKLHKKLKGSKKDTHAMVMNNWCNLGKMYDLKGAINNRDNGHKCMIFLQKFKLGKIKATKFKCIFDKITKDVNFLQDHKLLDYSLGIWVVPGHSDRQEQAPSVHVIHKGKKYTFYFGVVDIPQPWTGVKKAEARWKARSGSDRLEPSCTHYDRYAARMLCFLALMLPVSRSERNTLVTDFLTFDAESKMYYRCLQLLQNEQDPKKSKRCKPTRRRTRAKSQ